jgi:hypothetical protein
MKFYSSSGQSIQQSGRIWCLFFLMHSTESELELYIIMQLCEKVEVAHGTKVVL